MRKAHIDYLKAMLVAISFPGQLLEVYPAEDKLPQMIPCAPIKLIPTQNRLDARLKSGNRIAKLPPVTVNGVKSNRYLKSHFKQAFKYQVDLWLKNPVTEILSTPANPGYVDKAMVYVSENQTIAITLQDIEYKITVDIGASGDITDDSDKSIYKYYLEVIFRDGLYSIEEAETLAGAALEIEQPVEVEVV
jgi:hypothetical protein